MTKNRPTVLLSEAFPSYLEGEGIFSEMSGVPWAETITADLLDLDYFANHSGDKKCSPVVYKLMEDDHTIASANRTKLASLILARFLPNWTALWNTYYRGNNVNPFQDYSMTETGESEEGTTGVHTGTKSGTNTGTDNLAVTYGETITTQEARHDAASQNRYGFNSSTAVPTDAGTSDTTNNRTDTHGGTDNHNRTLNLANSETSSDNETGSKEASYSKTRSGLTGARSLQSIIREERELWIEDYFVRVYADVDSVLASMVYPRDHEANPFCIFGFGYYQI